MFVFIVPCYKRKSHQNNISCLSIFIFLYSCWMPLCFILKIIKEFIGWYLHAETLHFSSNRAEVTTFLFYFNFFICFILQKTVINNNNNCDVKIKNNFCNQDAVKLRMKLCPSGTFECTIFHLDSNKLLFLCTNTFFSLQFLKKHDNWEHRC